MRVTVVHRTLDHSLATSLAGYLDSTIGDARETADEHDVVSTIRQDDRGDPDVMLVTLDLDRLSVTTDVAYGLVCAYLAGYRAAIAAASTAAEESRRRSYRDAQPSGISTIELSERQLSTGRMTERARGLYHDVVGGMGRALRKGDVVAWHEIKAGGRGVEPCDSRRWTLDADPIRSADGTFGPQRIPCLYLANGSNHWAPMAILLSAFDITGCGNFRLAGPIASE